MARINKQTARLRHRLYEILEQGPYGDRTSAAVSRSIALLIIVNLLAVILQSVPELEARYEAWFILIELLSLVVFSVEYGLRLWVAAEHARFLHMTPGKARLKYAMSSTGIIDLVAVLPFWFAFVIPADLRFVLVLRIIRFLKLARYSPGMRSLLDALSTERRALFSCLVILFGVTLFAAALMHIVEGRVQPDKLGTIPDALWWAIVTLGTIGYGDVIPVTPLGRVVASFTIIAGLMMIALPVGIIATAFANEIHRRDFVVTWGMLARVPIFSELDAADIADIMRLLRAQTVDPGTVITRRGEAAHSMYVIAAGEVEIELADRRQHLVAGQFFGEVAVLRRARRSATAVALTRTSLLVLDAQDLHVLMGRSPRIAAHIRDVMRDRVGAEVVDAKGDIVLEEIEEEPRAE